MRPEAEGLEVCPGVRSPASAADRCGWLRALSLASWVALSAPLPREPSVSYIGKHSPAGALPQEVVAVTQGKRPRRDRGLPERPPLPPGVTRLFVICKDKRGPVPEDSE